MRTKVSACSRGAVMACVIGIEEQGLSGSHASCATLISPMRPVLARAVALRVVTLAAGLIGRVRTRSHART
jgi:hypothetical protein